jgi:hypothetical protein
MLEQVIRRSARNLVRAASLAAAVACVGIGAGTLQADPVGKVEICHFPPGNPDNFHTLSVGAPAVSAHLAHGDSLGACENDCKLFANRCDDGNACTADLCDSATGACMSQPQVDCDDGNACTADACNPASGACEAVPRAGEPCDDSDVCSENDRCDANGQCAGTALPACCATAADCDDGNACTEDSCTALQCEHAPVVCDDGNACTADACDPTNGSCISAVVQCDDGNSCTVDSCDADRGCQNLAVACECTLGSGAGEMPCGEGLPCCDGRECAPDGSCPAGLCVGFDGECGEGIGTCCPGLMCWDGFCTSG